MSALAGSLPREAVEAKTRSIVATAAVAFAVFSSGFVMNEPAPYELILALMIGVWALFGMRLSPYPSVLLALLVVYNVGGLVSMTQMDELFNGPMYLAVSLFLAFTAVFFAAACEANHALFRVIYIAWVFAAMATGVLGIAGYFSLFPGAAGAFTLYDRGTGAFKDPNVFGPYLVLPAVYLLHCILTERVSRLPFYGFALVVITAAIFVSFSRGAWGLYAASAVIVVAALFLHSMSALLRLRILVMSFLAFALIGGAILVALQVPGTAEFFTMRAQLVQDYDGGQMGRFARFGMGFQLAMERPFGIGILNFGRMFGEDTHNVWLKALMDYSWLGFAAFFIIVVWTVAGGFRILFRDRPWQPYLLCAWAVFVGHVVLGTIIDMDHWRHFYLLIGLIWGCMALERRHQLGSRADRRALPVAGAA